MYTLVNKNKVISGPRSWDKAFFGAVLKRKKLESGFIPRNPTDELPYEISADIKIYPVKIVKPEINEFIEYHRGPSWEIKESVAVATYEIVETKLESAKTNYKEFLAAERYEKEVAGTSATVQDIEVSVETSRDGRNTLVQQYLIMGDNETVNWKFPEGWFTLTKEEFGVIIISCNEHIQGAFDWEKEISDQIDLETVVQDLVKYEEIIKPTESEVEND